MNDINSIISEAKIAITDANVNAFNAANSNSKLKIHKEMDFLMDAIGRLEKSKPSSLLGKFKDLMYDTQADKNKDKLAKEVIDSIAQMSYCLRCRCASCPIMDDDCQCKGCVPGAYVVKCPGGNGVEERKVTPNTVMFDKRPIIKLEHDRTTGGNTATLVTNNGFEERKAIELK